jgi:AcrR family transcriptional regulator
MPAIARKPKHRRRGRPADNRVRGDLALLRVGQAAFARHGFEGTSLRKIAATAGVDPGLAAHHFGSKEALWEAVVDRLSWTLTPAIENLERLQSEIRVPIGTRLGQALRQLVSLLCEEPELGMFITRVGVEKGEKLTHLTDKLIRPYHDAFTPLLIEAMRKKVISRQPVEVLYYMLTFAVSMTVSYRHIVEASGAHIEGTDGLKTAITQCLFATFLGKIP